MKINKYILKIKKLGACEEAVKAAHEYKTSQELWDDCERGDWMLWLIGKLSGEAGSEKRKPLVLTACKCARLALKYIPKDELRPLKAIEIAEKWAKGEASLQEAKDAFYTADAAAFYAADAAAAAAFYAANAAFYAAAAAADAAFYAAAAASYADIVREKTLAKCAEIVRKDYPNVDKLW